MEWGWRHKAQCLHIHQSEIRCSPLFIAHFISIKEIVSYIQYFVYFSIITNQVNKALLLASSCFTLDGFHYRNITSGTVILIDYPSMLWISLLNFISSTFISILWAYVTAATHLEVQITSWVWKLLTSTNLNVESP